MRKMACLIVEDEPLAAEVLQDYIRQIPHLQLVDTCSDALYAIDILKEKQIDLVFLDIHLPRLKGLEFIKTLSNPPKVIITTAYQDYAVQGYELNVVDYLLKPIEFSRFVQAVNKARQPSQKLAGGFSIESGGRSFQFFTVGKKKVKVFLDEILYVESLKEYIKIVSKDQSILTKFQLGQTEALFRDKNFLRVHRSFIVAKDKIDAYTATEIELKGNSIPIGRSYKEQVYEELGTKNLK